MRQADSGDSVIALAHSDVSSQQSLWALKKFDLEVNKKSKCGYFSFDVQMVVGGFGESRSPLFLCLN